MVYFSIRQVISDLVKSSLERYVSYSRLIVDQLHTRAENGPVVEQGHPASTENIKAEYDDASEHTDHFESRRYFAREHKDDRTAVNIDQIAAHAATRVDGKRCECNQCRSRALTFPKNHTRRRRVCGRLQPRRAKWADITCSPPASTDLASGTTSHQPWGHIQLIKLDSEAITTASEPDIDMGKHGLGVDTSCSPPIISSACGRRQAATQLGDADQRWPTLGPNRFQPLEVERTRDEMEIDEAGRPSSRLRLYHSSDEASSIRSSKSENSSVVIRAAETPSLADPRSSDELVPLLDSDNESENPCADIDLDDDEEHLEDCLTPIYSLPLPLRVRPRPAHDGHTTSERASRTRHRFVQPVRDHHCGPPFRFPARLGLDGATVDADTTTTTTTKKENPGGWSNEGVVKWASRVGAGDGRLEPRRWRTGDFSLVGRKKRDTPDSPDSPAVS